MGSCFVRTIQRHGIRPRQAKRQNRGSWWSGAKGTGAIAGAKLAGHWSPAGAWSFCCPSAGPLLICSCFPFPAKQSARAINVLIGRHDGSPSRDSLIYAVLRSSITHVLEHQYPDRHWDQLLEAPRIPGPVKLASVEACEEKGAQRGRDMTLPWRVRDKTSLELGDMTDATNLDALSPLSPRYLHRV
ncbi:uncharacterized protein B0I36DRAFT_322534 [Microdochium trichocladiopsis]|uniref:Uncharacterized protein n=1 Tax=Microdochium trichocladiopsis TaxID=1682393 RepID=A0A9P8Y5Q7_9PEZI|nr:uncharacterized protein B0I36DRAFT_322534 [Microdochium trichocladiopsis]KAH7030821.1 hypothetical protein B0I36DRAFT_322534 [Microdochium trichocladiopsis]